MIRLRNQFDIHSSREGCCFPTLSLKAIGRRDLIYSKLYAAADRIDDVDDLVALKPTELELVEARELVLQQDASEIWPEIVDECLEQMRKRLGYVK